MIKSLALLVACGLAATPAWSAEKLFDIVKADGTVQPVTDEDYKVIGNITIETSLVGGDDHEKIHQVTGPRLRDVLKHFSVSGHVIDAVALDSYRIEIPVSDATKYDVVLANTIDGKQLSVRDRGPVWIIYPVKDNPELHTPVFEARSIWQLKELRMK